MIGFFTESPTNLDKKKKQCTKYTWYWARNFLSVALFSDSSMVWDFWMAKKKVRSFFLFLYFFLAFHSLHTFPLHIYFFESMQDKALSAFLWLVKGDLMLKYKLLQISQSLNPICCFQQSKRSKLFFFLSTYISWIYIYVC